MAGRRRLGAQPRASPRAGSGVSRVERLEDTQVLYGSGRDIVRSGRAPGFEPLLDDVWRERGFGDFWGYALVAEGAAEAMVEVGLKSWDAAAPAVIIEEAGAGRPISTAGAPSIRGRSSSPTACSTRRSAALDLQGRR